MRGAILFLLLTALAYTLYSNFFADKERVKVGSEAPDFVVTDLSGDRRQLSDYRGKGVLLNFWGTWCEPCKKEMPYMDNQYRHYKDLGVEILAVNIAESDLAVNSFAKQHGLSFPIGIDKDRQILDQYGVKPLPTTFLINQDGKVTRIVKGELTERNIRDMMESIKP